MPSPNRTPSVSSKPLADDTLHTYSKDTHPKTLAMTYLKGIAMGAADIVPGVSGGTIALIAGIYQRLVGAIGSIGPELIPLWREAGLLAGFRLVWQRVDATFLLSLLAGIATSFMALAGMIKYLLEEQPLLIWSFFFGLVVATVVILLRDIERWTLPRAALFLLGLLTAVAISLAPMLTSEPSLPFLFFAGALAICAMILPGISGSFILLLLGSYHVALDALHSFNLPIIATLLAGMVSGILLFTRFLKWLLAHYYQGTLVLLTGFVAGSLVKIWPWQTTVSGHLLPWHYPSGAAWVSTLGLMLLGAMVVSGLSWLGNRTGSA